MQIYRHKVAKNANAFELFRGLSLPFAVWGIIVLASMLYNVSAIKRHYLEVNREHARAFVKQVVISHLWNARHGGVYAPVSEQTPPNPYLDDPDRDVTTTKGVKLTKINPAYMTRQIAEIARDAHGVQFHLTSVKPIRPENRAELWEMTALLQFEKGVKEWDEFDERSASPVFRYMTSLNAEASCLNCHAKQGYKQGDVRGGISVTIPIESTLARYGYDRVRLVVSHSLIFLLGLGALLFFGRYSRRTENALREYSEELERGNRDLIDFSNIVAHDLRAPLVSIKGFSGELEHTAGELRALMDTYLSRMEEKDRAKMETLLRKDLSEALTYISSSVKRMDGLLGSLLKLAREGKRELKPERIAMEALTRGILDTMAHQIGAKNVRTVVAALPEIYADRAAMEQVMGNLLDNAVKYLDPARRGELTITAETHGGESVFHVRDNGCGIAREDMHKVFELFRRAGKQDVPGEGMGLAYVKTIIKRHGGRIWCESESGVGTTFSFTVPRRHEGAA